MPDEMMETSDEDNNTNNNTNVHFSNLKPRYRGHFIIPTHSKPNSSPTQTLTQKFWVKTTHTPIKIKLFNPIFSETENTDYLSSSQNSPGDVISNFVNTIKRSIGRKLPPTPLKSPFSNEMIESYVPKENG